MTGMVLFTVLALDAAAVLDSCSNAWSHVQDYTCSLFNYVNQNGKTESATYYVQFMRPGWVKYTVIEGSHKGSKAAYNPNTKKVNASLGGILGFLKISADPWDSRVTNSRGERMDRSDFGHTINQWKKFNQQGKVVCEGETTVDGLSCYKLVAQDLDPAKNHGDVKIEMFVRSDMWLPYKFIHYNSQGGVNMKAIFRDIKINTGLSQSDFKI